MNELPFRRAAMPVAEKAPTTSTWLRAVIAHAASKLDTGVRAAEYASGRWPDDPGVVTMLRAAQTPTMISNSPALAAVSTVLADILAPTSASGELIRRGLTVSFGSNGTIKVPSVGPGSASFIAEGAPIPVKQLVTSGPTLTPYKLACITTLSGEMVRHTDAERLFSAALNESVGPGLDAVLFSNAAAVPGVSPAGLFNGITPLTPAATGSGKDDTMTADVATLFTAVAPVAGGMDFLLVASPKQAVSLSFRQGVVYPGVVASSALPDKTVAMIVPSAVAIAIDAPRIDSSTEAVLHTEDTSPGAVVASAPTRSLWQTDSVGLRLLAPASWGLRDVRGVAWMQNVNW